MAFSFSSLTGGETDRMTLVNEGIVKDDLQSPKENNMIDQSQFIVELGDPTKRDRFTPVQLPIPINTNGSETRETMKDPSKSTGQFDGSIMDQAAGARSAALEWLQQGYNFWIVAAIIIFLISRKK